VIIIVVTDNDAVDLFGIFNHPDGIFKNVYRQKERRKTERKDI